MKTATLRPFRADDLPRILAIEKESFGRDAWPADLFREYAAEDRCWFLVAQFGASVAGYGIACPRRESIEIDSIAVARRCRGKGIATLLMKAAIRRARRCGAPAVTLMVRRDNREAIGLYRNLGFVRSATVRGYYEDGASGWRMRLLLAH